MKKTITVLVTLLIMLLLASVSCNAGDEDSPFFPVQKTGLDQMEALMKGVLVLDNGYLRVESIYSDDSYLLIWPYGFSRRTEGEEILIINGDGKTVAHVGDMIQVGGGEDGATKDYIGQKLPDDVKGPYWIVGEFVGADSNATGEYSLGVTSWILKSFGEPDNLKTLLDDTEITLTLDGVEGTLTGSAGCNNYSGNYEAQGLSPKNFTLLGPIVSTEMSCGEQIDKQEYEYLAALGTAESYKFEDSKLEITCGEQVLIFNKK